MLAAYTALCFALNFAIVLAIRHVFHTSGYTSVASVRNLLLWACAINLAGSALYVLFARTWQRRFLFTATIDLLISLSPFLLIRLLRISALEPRMHWLGLAYTLFVVLKCIALVQYSLANATSATRRALRAWVFSVSLITYVGFVPWITRSIWPTGDEPHYLLLTHSLIADHDFDLANNYFNGDYKSFYPVPLDRHVIKNGRGQEYPIHDIGLSLLLIPGYALGNRTGALVELAFPAALAALGMLELALQLGADPFSALLAWGLFSFTAPVVVFASQFYPEVVGAAGMVWALIALVHFTRDNRQRWLFAAGIVLALLPWVSVRFWTLVGVLLAVIAVWLFWQGPVGKSKSNGWSWCVRALAELSAPMAISLALFAIFDMKHYGMLLPNAGYVVDVRNQPIPHFWHRPQTGLLGLFLDRAYGLLTIAPSYIVVLAAIRKLGRSPRVIRMAILLPAAVYVGFISFNRYWSGGWCPAGRFLVVPAVMCAPLAALLLPARRCRWVAYVLGAWTILIAIIEMAFPATRFVALPDITRSGLSAFLKHYAGFDPFSTVFPSFVRAQTADFLVAAVWIIVLAAGIWFLTHTTQPVAASESQDERRLLFRRASVSDTET